MKNKLAKILMLLLSLFCITALAACQGEGAPNTEKPGVDSPSAEELPKEEEPTEHSHSFTDYVSDANATCTADGTKTAKCDTCDEKDTTVDIGSALGHDKIPREAKLPTCLDIGYNAYETCSRCDFTTYAEIDCLGHSYTKANYSDTHHWTECSHCNAKQGTESHTLDTDGKCACGYGCQHEEGTKATCKVQAICSKCGNHYGELADHVSEEIPAVSPTCEASGLTAGTKCSVCDITLTAQTIVEELGHSFTNYAFDNNATCTADGTKTATCDRAECNRTHTVTDGGSALGHSFTNYISDNNAEVGKDGTKTAKCDRCDETSTITDEGTALEEEKYSEGLAFTLNDDGESYSVTGIGTCTDTEIYIPNFYKSFSVTSVEVSAFENCTSMTKLVIPDSVTEIGDDAFYGCKNLKDIVLPNSNFDLLNIFYGCTKLKTTVGGVTYIGKYVAACDEKATSVVINAGTLGIGQNAFLWCTDLRSITIHNGLESIGDSAFWGCESLQSIALPASVTEIFDYAFYACTALESINIPNEAEYLGAYAFGECINLKSITVPKNIKTVEHDTFYNCTGLTEVNILGAEKIGDRAFYNCVSINSLNIVEGIEKIGIYTFYGCSSLSDLMIPESITDLGACSFEDCSGLKIIAITKSIGIITEALFADCINLEKIVFDGTINDWQDMKKQNYWNDNTGEYTVYCTDGTVAKDGTVTYY